MKNNNCALIFLYFQFGSEALLSHPKVSERIQNKKFKKSNIPFERRRVVCSSTVHLPTFFLDPHQKIYCASDCPFANFLARCECIQYMSSLPTPLYTSQHRMYFSRNFYWQCPCMSFILFLEGTSSGGKTPITMPFLVPPVTHLVNIISFDGIIYIIHSHIMVPSNVKYQQGALNERNGYINAFYFPLPLYEQMIRWTLNKEISRGDVVAKLGGGRRANNKYRVEEQEKTKYRRSEWSDSFCSKTLKTDNRETDRAPQQPTEEVPEESDRHTPSRSQPRMMHTEITKRRFLGMTWISCM